MINALVFSNPLDTPWQITGVYGPSYPSQHKFFWAALDELAVAFSSPWLILGDFNTVLSQADKIGGKPVASSASCGLNGIISRHGFMDVGFHGCPYTWSNGRAGVANIQAHLDRGLVNAGWRILFPDAQLFHLPAFQSNHKPLLMRLRRKTGFHPRPFRFEGMWTLEQSSMDVVRLAWHADVPGSPLFQLVCSVRNTEVELKKWNKKVFGRVQDNIHELRHSIEVLQSSPLHPTLILREHELQSKLEDLLRKEELLWKEKAKEKWIEDGDRNTKFFHLATVIRRRFNHIAAIHPGGSGALGVATCFETIGEGFKKAFGVLFSTVHPVFPEHLEGLFPHFVSSLDCAGLAEVPSPEEIRGVVFSMSNGKSSGPDGLSPFFYKFYWEIIKERLVKAVQFFFLHGVLIHPLNYTFITLIPKRENPSLVEHYCPISLCNVVYKVISKLLANRLKPLLGQLISPHQSAFIPGRTMTDSVITCHELMHHINRKKGSLNLMAVKLDLSKAYDKVEWGVLKQILVLHGLHDKFIELIMECISIASFSIFINGSPFGHFLSSRGLRQGDPLSPALFVIFIDLLSRLLTRAEVCGDLHGVKIGRCCPPVSHLLYADDVTILCRAEVAEARRLAGILQTFSDWSGQCVNWDKSLIHFRNHTEVGIRRAICSILHIPECNHKVTYLGNHFCKPPSKRLAFNGIMEKLKDRLSGWRGKLLSQAGRLTMMKSVAEICTQHSIQAFL